MHLVQHCALLPQLVGLVEHITRTIGNGSVRRLNMAAIWVAATPPADLHSEGEMCRG